MQQVTPHIVVVAHSGNKPTADRSAPGPAESADATGFAQLLAGQIDAKAAVPAAQLTAETTQTSAKKPIAMNGLPGLDDATANPAPAAGQTDPLLQQALETLALQQSASQFAPAQVARACCEPNSQKAAIAAQGSDPLALPDADAPPLPELAATPAKAEADPAKFAAMQQVAKDDAADVKPLLETKAPSQPVVALTPMQTHQPASAGSNAPLSIPIPVADKGWDNAFAQRVVWVANNHQQSAQLHVTPPNLGPVEIRISMNGEQTSAMFISPHASVREAIESALPRLREMFSDSGLTLGNVNVTSQHQQQQQAQQQRQGRAQPRFDSQGVEIPAIGATSAGVASVRMGREGLVDIFA